MKYCKTNILIVNYNINFKNKRIFYLLSLIKIIIINIYSNHMTTTNENNKNVFTFG